MRRPVNVVPARLLSRAAAAGLALLLASSQGRAAAEFEQPTLALSEMVPAELIMGPHHVLAEPVTMDGNRAMFDIHSAHGPFRAPGLELLALRVAELPAIDALTKIHKGEAFVDALGKAAKAPLDFVGKLLTSPGATLGNVASGIGNVIGKAGNVVRSGVETLADGASDLVTQAPQPGTAAAPGGPGDTGTGTLGEEQEPPAFTSDPFGYNKARRQWAKSLNVDPYTSNPVLQKLLDEAASATFAGSFAVDTTLGLVAAPVKFAVGFETESRDAVWDLSPGDIELRNEARLKAIGIEGRPVRDFFRNRWFTPTLQTALVDALERIGEVKGHGRIIEAAIQTRGETRARGLIANLNLLARFHQTTPLAQLHPDGPLLLATGRQGEAVVAMSADYLCWNAATAALDALPAAHADLLTGSRRILLAPGRISQRASAELEKSGWTISAAYPYRNM